MKTVKKTRDTFALSLGGMNVITAFAAAPAIAYDRLYQVRENRPRQSTAACDCSPSLQLVGLGLTAPGACA